MPSSPFNPWAWRDPSALAGGYTPAAPDAGPPDEPERRDGGPDAPGPGTPIDLVGYRVEATDGRIGSVDEASHDSDAGYLVVDTGPWIFGRTVLLPAGTVARVDHLARTVHVDRTRQQVKDSPAADVREHNRPEYRDQLGTYYAESYRQD
ncbi:PRC-barrel domain-containing protein [Micromonospora sp. WMMD812]|uniref:PRC-barrel domain-containing protein n=1 Tax=Micromonospora sp. WMMD812 TaxID=3015152 RepID=UPI00248CAC60|nr:PRC-barrel domain-containing protein [Micromonospora sp. WMMD812]WBB65920.1 PRC-barrel domain-containing protein [Micromonospora sp. WMMD812]